MTCVSGRWKIRTQAIAPSVPAARIVIAGNRKAKIFALPFEPRPSRCPILRRELDFVVHGPRGREEGANLSGANDRRGQHGRFQHCTFGKALANSANVGRESIASQSRPGGCSSATPMSVCRAGCGERRIIGVTVRAAAIGGASVERCQDRPVTNTLWQIGVGDERTAERDRIGVSQPKRLGSALRRVGGSGNERTKKRGPEQCSIVESAVVKLVCKPDFGTARLLSDVGKRFLVHSAPARRK